MGVQMGAVDVYYDSFFEEFRVIPFKRMNIASVL